MQGVDAVAEGTAVQDLNRPDRRVLSIVAPSASDQGITDRDWEAGAIVLFPAAFLDTDEARRALSPSLVDALRTCPTDLGDYTDLAAWKTARNPLTTGKVAIGGQTFFQFVIHRLRWKSRVSNTGRGYRVSDFSAETFGAVRAVSAGRKLKTVAKVALVAVNAPAGAQTVAHLPPVTRDTVTARCDNNSAFDIRGVLVNAPGSGWFSGGAGQPFNVLIEIIEEAGL